MSNEIRVTYFDTAMILIEVGGVRLADLLSPGSVTSHLYHYRPDAAPHIKSTTL